jgi:hypothetical protein
MGCGRGPGDRGGSFGPGSRGPSTGLHAAEYHGSKDQSEPVQRQKACADSVLQHRFQPDLNRQSGGQDGRP